MRDLKTTKNLYVIITIFIVLGVFLVFTNSYGIKTLTGVRGYISGEGHWAKSQKQSVIELIHYIYYQDDIYYDRFLNSLSVIKGDKRAKEALSSEIPDYDAAYDGFLEGKVHPEEIGPVIWLFDNFQNVSFLKEAIGYWDAGDEKIEQLLIIGGEIHEISQNRGLTDQERDMYLVKISELNHDLTILEDNFSSTMGEAAIFVSNLIYWSVLIFGLVLIIGGGLTTVFYYRGIHKLNEQLLVTDKKFRTVLENSQDVIYQMDPDGSRYEYMSPTVEHMLGYTAGEIMEKGPAFIMSRIHPDDLDRLQDELSQFTSTDSENRPKLDTEFRVKTRWGNYIWVNNKRTLLKDADEKTYGIVGNVRDISERKQYVDQINKSLKIKESLLAEMHHRVKNNLAIVTNMIELQKNGTDEQRTTREFFQEVQSRIQSIALVHEKLYQSKTFSEINLSEYIDDLTDTIEKAFQDKTRPVKFEKCLTNVKLDIIHAIPLGLIYNELINNVFKHAFNGKEEGVIQVGFRVEENIGILTVADNGAGLPDHFDMKNSDSLGMTLINTFSAQLDGQIEVVSNGWTEFKISFKLPAEDKQQVVV